MKVPVTPTFVRALGAPTTPPRRRTTTRRRLDLLAWKSVLRRLRSATSSEQPVPARVEDPQLVRWTPPV